ncbi:kinase-like domain-containing protein [Sparassis latifolia]
MHSLSLAHTDLKPDNVILRSPDIIKLKYMRPDNVFALKPIFRSVELCIIDLGEAEEVLSESRGRVGTSAYCAPEVTLGLAWTIAVDEFALGCIIAELYTAKDLFHATSTTQERMALLEHVLGTFPLPFALKADAESLGVFEIKSSVRVCYPPDYVNIQYNIKQSVLKIIQAQQLQVFINDPAVYDLCSHFLYVDLAYQLTALEAARHPFFSAIRGYLD